MAGAERGVVLEIKGGKVIVLTPEGEFRQLRPVGPLPSVGEEIMLAPAKPSAPAWRKIAAMVAAIGLLVLGMPWVRAFLPGTQEPAFYISVDINPSVELTVNNRERVIEARALNNEGEAMLAGLNLKGQVAEAAIGALAREAVKQGYYRLGQEGILLLTVVPAVETEEKVLAGDQLAARLATAAEKVLQEDKIIPVVKSLTLQPILRENAFKVGLSPGKYAVLLEALAAGVPVSDESLKQQRIAEVLSRAGGDWRKVLQSLTTDKNLEEKEKKLRPLLEKALTPSLTQDIPGSPGLKPEYFRPKREEPGMSDKPGNPVITPPEEAKGAGKGIKPPEGPSGELPQGINRGEQENKVVPEAKDDKGVAEEIKENNRLPQTRENNRIPESREKESEPEKGFEEKRIPRLKDRT